MFRLAEQKEMGTYIENKVLKMYKNKTDFVRAYLKLLDGSDEDSSRVVNMANRLSKICKGEYSIQVYDLPIFSELLDISIENLLTSGRYEEANRSHFCNYMIAKSPNKELWKEYINKYPKQLNHLDEFGKSILDYVIEFDNYDLLNYFLDENLLVFEEIKKHEMPKNFMELSYRPSCVLLERQETGTMDAKLMLSVYHQEDDLRNIYIRLAILHNDVKRLKKMNANKISWFYDIFPGITEYTMNSGLYDSTYYDDERILDALTHASDDVINYFLEDVIQESIQKQHPVKYTYKYFGLSKLADLMIAMHHPRTKDVLETCLAHNEMILDGIDCIEKKLLAIDEKIIRESYDESVYTKEFIEEQCKYGLEKRVHYIEKGSLVSVNIFAKRSIDIDNFVTNIMHIQNHSDDQELEVFIEKINDCFENVINEANNSNY